MKHPIAAIAFSVMAAATGALASAPQPKKPFALDRMPGHWYEIARTPNQINQNCQASSTDWVAAGDSKFKITATCRKGAPDGPAQVVHGDVSITDAASHAKVRMSLFGGLISRDYWLLDHADDYSWLIMGTPSGNFISIMAARPALTANETARALSDVRSMGYDVTRLVFPVQTATD